MSSSPKTPRPPRAKPLVEHQHGGALSARLQPSVLATMHRVAKSDAYTDGILARRPGVRKSGQFAQTLARPPSPSVIPLPKTVVELVDQKQKLLPELERFRIDIEKAKHQHQLSSRGAASTSHLGHTEHEKQQRSPALPPASPQQSAKEGIEGNTTTNKGGRHDFEKAVLAHLKFNHVLTSRQQRKAEEALRLQRLEEKRQFPNQRNASPVASPNSPTSQRSVGERTFQLVPPEEQWLPGLNTLFMEATFSRDMWHHVGYSDLRVSYCRCGGSSNNEDFKRIRHEPHFLAITDTSEDVAEAPPAIEASGESGVLSPSPTTANELLQSPSKLISVASRIASKNNSNTGAKQDRETLLFRLTQTNDQHGGYDPHASHSATMGNSGRNAGGGGGSGTEVFAAHVTLLDVRGDSISSAHGGDRRSGGISRPRLTEEQEKAAKAIGAANSEFRRMVAYRRQDVHDRYARASEEHTATAHQCESGIVQHERFQRHMQNESKTLYLNGAEEVERWNDDRQRMFDTKYRTIDISRAQPTWQTAMRDIRSKVATKLESEFSQERSRLQREFYANFTTAIGKYFSSLSLEAQRIMEVIRVSLSKGEPFGPPNVAELVKSVPIDAFFLDDVVSVIYSLAIALNIPDKYWRDIIKEQTHFLSHRKELVEPDDDPQSARWVLRIRPVDIGPNAFLFATCFPACKSLTSDELKNFIAHYPKRKFVEAILALRSPDVTSPELRAAVDSLTKVVKCPLVDQPATAESTNSAVVLNSADYRAFSAAAAALKHVK